MDRRKLLLSDRRRRTRRLLIGLIAALVLAQPVAWLVFGHSNPPVRSEPDWSAAPPGVERLARDACYDCHSNETRWPWYTWVFPASWLVWTDVDGGRASGNFSEWDTSPMQADEVEAAITGGRMPPDSYTWLHPAARLSDAEKQALIEGLAQVIGPPGDAPPASE